MVISQVLISRPGPEASELAGMLRHAGLMPVVIPAFNFESDYTGLDFNSSWHGDGRKLVIFCSPRAVEFGLRQLPAGFLDELEIAAIGPATANLLESAGQTVTILPDGEFNSEALLANPALNERAGEALIFAAPGGRQALFSGLKKRSWQVEFAHVYRMVPLAADASAIEALEQDSQIISVWTSAKAMGHLSESLGKKAWENVCRGQFVVTSKRLADLAQAHAPGRVHVTDGPGNTDIMNCIAQLI